jgi:hypothetical protein
MAELRNKPVLIERVRLWWYGIAILPILALVYLGFTGILSPFIGLMGLFAFFFWLFSFGFAIASKLRKPPADKRQ